MLLPPAVSLIKHVPPDQPLLHTCVVGRMHKPVSVVQSCAELQGVLQLNLRSAVRAALLLLPETFSDFELFTMIAGLSYRGDPRMTFGENPRKVKNIVSANLPHFHDLYR